MPESVIQPEPGQQQEALEQPAREQASQETGIEIRHAEVPREQNIIWTPRFLLVFALLLIVGTSAESLFASGWSTGVFTAQGLWFILGHIGLALLGWLALGIVTRSRWTRLGCIFGGVCAVFLTLNAFTSLAGGDPNSPIQSYVNVASCIALLGAYIGLSIEGTLLTAWDHWLLFLLPIVGAAWVLLTYQLTPQASLLTTENACAAAAVFASLVVWWGRPSCWKRMPGPTFLFGLVSIIQLLMSSLNESQRNFFLLQVLLPHISIGANISNFFYAQFILLCLFLGCLRLAKSEIRN